jgi:hypothetical protein
VIADVDDLAALRHFDALLSAEAIGDEHERGHAAAGT